VFILFNVLTNHRSMPPLLFSLNPSNRGTLSKLKQTRETLSAELTCLINTLAPEIFPDFDASRVIAAAELPKTPHHTRRRSSQSTDDGLVSPIGSGVSGFTPLDLPRGEKFENLGDVQIFASRPPSRSGRRSRSTSLKEGVGVDRLSGFTSGVMNDEPELIDGTQEGFDEITRRIRGGMAARRMERLSLSNGSNGKKGQ
jgi:glycerol-3-phosphate O-acyltransferase/dihydroxyacetone phosphate acyltransferase